MSSTDSSTPNSSPTSMRVHSACSDFYSCIKVGQLWVGRERGRKKGTKWERRREREDLGERGKRGEKKGWGGRGGSNSSRTWGEWEGRWKRTRDILRRRRGRAEHE